MRRFVFLIACSMIVVSCFTHTVLAQGKGKVSLKAVAEVEKEGFNEEGKKVLKRFPANKVIPGDTVIYTIHYANDSKETADDVSITNPVPEHMMYSEGSASGKNTSVTFSIDGGKHFDAPENLKVKMDDGTERPARPEEYTTIRWTFNGSLSAGKKGVVAFAAILK